MANNIIQQLTEASKQRDEEASIAIAKQLAQQEDTNAIQQIVTHLSDKKLQNSCIKILYECGYINPELITPYTSTFVMLLTHKNNRLQWGAMTALACITPYKPAPIVEYLPAIMNAANKGSVITRDAAFKILAALSSKQAYKKLAFPLLNEMLITAPINQLPMYAELAFPVATAGDKTILYNTLTDRMASISAESKRKRIEKVLKKLGQH